MSDSSSEDECRNHPNSGRGKFILYSNRPDWKDVVPVPQNDGPNPVVAIAYSEKFRDVYNYFRAILLSQEKSDRALELTEDALDLNPANYTVWQYRREILKAMNKNLNDELDYVRSMIKDHPKNYQVWHHRKVIVEWKQDASEELGLTRAILSLDAKNYHAWQHRQWVIKTFNLFQGELNYTEDLLKEDERNNSAWNQRYFVIQHTTGFTYDVIEREVMFTEQRIKCISNNESAWNYLRGILQHKPRTLDSHPFVTLMCEEMYKEGNPNPYLMSFMVDYLSIRVKESGDRPAYDRVLQLLDYLAKDQDSIRAEYWAYLAVQLAPYAKKLSDLERETPIL